MASADSGSPRRRHFTIGGSVLAILGVGLGSVLVTPLITAPNGFHARRVLSGLASGTMDFTGPNLLGFLLFTFGMFLTPLVVMAAFIAIERWAEPEMRLRKSRVLPWLVQAMFISSMTIFVILWGQLGLNPEPLFKAPAGAGSVFLPAAFYLAFLLVHDIVLYWLHRAQHHFPSLWKFHAVHHGEELSALHNIVHPVEQACIFLFVFIPTIFLVNVSQSQVLFLATFFVLQGPFIHSRLPLNFGRLGLILNDNRHHYLHHDRHAARSCNYAARFPFIDLMFGTYRKPGDGPLPETGLADKAPPASLRHYIFARLSEREPVPSDEGYSRPEAYNPHQGMVPQ